MIMDSLPPREDVSRLSPEQQEAVARMLDLERLGDKPGRAAQIQQPNQEP